MATYSLKEASEKAGISSRTLRFYCDKGLVPGLRRDANNYRLFTEENVE